MKFMMIFNEKLYDQHDRDVELELSICALLKCVKTYVRDVKIKIPF